MQHKNESVNTTATDGEKSGEAQAERPKVMLEIGIGTYPLLPQPTMLIQQQDGHVPQHFPAGERMYIGIDKPSFSGSTFEAAGEDDDWSLEEASGEERDIAIEALSRSQQLLRGLRPGEAINTMAADGEHLPLGNETVDEVFMSDVLGAQLSPESMINLTGEVARVLRSGGILIVRETITPEAVPIDGMEPLFNHFGLQVTEHIQGLDNERYRELQDRYGVSVNELAPPAGSDEEFYPENMYYVVAEKMPEAPPA